MLRIFDPKTPIDFIGRNPLGLKISAGVFLLSLFFLMPFVRGINWGIDFAGGTEMQVKFSQQVSTDDIRRVLDEAGFEKKQVQSYGPTDTYEMLLRVERLTTLRAEDIEKVQQLLKSRLPTLAPGGSPEQVQVTFSEGEGDRVTIVLPAPSGAAAPQDGEDEAGSVGDATATAEHRLLQQQERALSQLLDTESGYRLRLTMAPGAEEATTEGAIHRDDPHMGTVKYLVYFQGISSEIQKALETNFGKIELRRVDFVDSKVAEQLRTDGLLAVLLAIFCILLYVAIRFDVYFAPGAIIALLHDAVIALVIFPLTWREFDLPSIAAILTVVGYSINDTIVMYDRVREVMPADKKSELTEEQVKGYLNQAINETFSRTINTGLTTLVATLALAIFAGGAVENFAIVLSVGIVVGTWSSIFIAPAVYIWARRNFHSPEGVEKQRKGLSREDKARGVV
jgi:preprotein translocase subunit SecF